MIIKFVEINNFRKLKACRIDLANSETVFVGANNSGKTSAMDALILFLKNRTSISTRDFTLSNGREINQIGKKWLTSSSETPPDLSAKRWRELIPFIDVWLETNDKEIHYISNLIPRLDWNGGLLGVRLLFEPDSIEKLYKEFTEYHHASSKILAASTKEEGKSPLLDLWPKTMWDYLERRLSSHFSVTAYVLDENKLALPIDGVAQSQELPANSTAVEGDPFKGLIKVDIINAQRGFSDPNNEKNEPSAHANLSTQLRDYYSRHLDPYEKPNAEDIGALVAMETAKAAFDERLATSFKPSLKELEELNYPGFGGNPVIRISSRIDAVDGLNHKSAVQFELLKSTDNMDNFPLFLPEKYNGLGYQNLISMVFKLIRFRDDWMQVGKSAKPIATTEEPEFEPLHLVLVEEPEAHLHAQVQQVFIKKAYKVLRQNAHLQKFNHFRSQMVVSTHSNHIAHEIDFTALRYFKRKPATKNAVPTSTVVNLSNTFGGDDETPKFARRYLRSTHCDLFFADAVILVEGSAERMLVPHFIKHAYPELNSCYISILEIGGRHGHKLRPLLEQLGIITLIITDLDSVDPTKRNSAVLPAIGKGYNSGNTVLRSWLPQKTSLDDLMKCTFEEKLDQNFPFRVAYQTTISSQFPEDKEKVPAIPYTFEIALALENKDVFSDFKEPNDMMEKFQEALKKTTTVEVNSELFYALSSRKKAEFALDILYMKDPETLMVPTYIAEGLNWLREQLNNRPSESK